MRPSSDFTRGWELLAHFVLMLKASLVRHALASGVLSLAMGSWWFSTTLPGDFDIARYLFSWASGSAADVHRHVALNGRTTEFLLQQWALRVISCWIVAFFLGSGFVARHGYRRQRRRKLRGVELRERPSDGWFRRHRADLLLTAIAFIIVAGITGMYLGDRAGAIPNFATAWITTESPRIARFLSPDGQGRVAWYEGPHSSGFRNNNQVRKQLEHRFGRTFPEFVVLFALRVLGAILLALLTARWFRRINPLSRPQDALPWRLAGVPVPDKKACYHFLFCGSPGSGKSTAIKETLDQIRQRGRRAIVYDLSGEYIEHFYREGTDLILNPLDGRSEVWTPWAEVKTDSDYTLLARSLFPPGGQEPFWADASATLFAATMKALSAAGRATNRELYEALTHGALEDLHEFLEGTQAARLLDPKAGAMPSNLIATVTSKLAAWSSLIDPGPDDTVFSIRDFVHRRGNDAWLFLSATEDQRPLLKPLLSLWSDIAATAILTLETTQESKIWFVLDEVASLQKLPALPGLLERGRKHGCAALLGLQAMPQLEEAYGSKLARAILSQPQTWLVLRSVEPDTARFLENALGRTEYLEPQTSFSMGAHAYRDGVSLQERIVTRPVALASEISSLPDLSGYLKLPGGNEIFRVAYDYKERPIVAPPFVPRSSC